jgi:hypothetical protein
LLARELAALDARERAAWAKIDTAQVGGRTWTAAQSTLNVIFRQRLDLLKAAGIDLEAARPPEKDRAMTLADALRASAAELLLAAPSVRDDMTFDQAITAFMEDLAAADEAVKAP